VDTVEIIRAKRDDHRLSDEQITWFIHNYAAGGVIADEQAAALAMAIFFRGMEPDELAVWTGAMVDSGSRLDLGGVGMPTVDKHSTGGVGDKVSLILVPLVAACGAAVPQLSGRGLGHSGGTLDKMEAISGWRASLSVDEMVDQMRRVGGVIAGATEDISPADRRLYALRDVTATVDSVPLIASSIMSKKIAEGTESLVLDVKFGSGAFMPELDRARDLARTMVGLGEGNGVRTVALITAMHTVLGRTAGHAREVAESHEVPEGGGPADTFATKDGWVLVHVVGRPLFERWARLMGEQHWLEDPRFEGDQDRGDNGALLSQRMTAWCAERSTAEVLAAMEELDMLGSTATPAAILIPFFDKTRLADYMQVAMQFHSDSVVSSQFSGSALK